MKYGLTDLFFFITFTNVLSLFNFFFYNSPNAALNCLFKCYDVTITYQPHWQVWLWCVWSAFEKNCIAQNPQVNLVHFITVPPFIQVHIILNASISISSFCLFVWTCGVEVAVMKHGMKISTVVAMDADWKIIIFSTWPKRQDYRFTQPRTCKLLSQERKKKLSQVTSGAPRVFVSATVWRVLGGKRWTSHGWNWKVADGWLRWLNIYIHILTYMQRWKDECWFE